MDRKLALLSLILSEVYLFTTIVQFLQQNGDCEQLFWLGQNSERWITSTSSNFTNSTTRFWWKWMPHMYIYKGILSTNKTRLWTQDWDNNSIKLKNKVDTFTVIVTQVGPYVLEGWGGDIAYYSLSHICYSFTYYILFLTALIHFLLLYMITKLFSVTVFTWIFNFFHLFCIEIFLHIF